MYAWLAVALLAVLACVIVMVGLFVAAWRRTLAQAEASGLRYRMRCETCGYEFDLSPRGFARSKFRRSRSTTRTRVKGVALVNEPRFAARFRVEGEAYRRPKFTDGDPALLPWLNRRSLSFCFSSPELSRTHSPAIAEEIADAFLLMRPVYRFLMGLD